MKFSSSVGLGLSVVFCCLLLALVAETYYLLWWKRRLIIGREIEDDYSNPTREILCILCWKTKKRPIRSTAQSTSHVLRITSDSNANNSSKDLHLKPLDENCIETGLMMGPPRFLFTIKEETKEDLESEDGRFKGESRRLSDLMRNEDTPYMTPITSPAFFTPPLTPSIGSSHSRSSSIGYNPFYESSTDVEFNKMRCSPPPKLKFLRDAEEKLRTRNAMEDEEVGISNSTLQEEEDGYFMSTIVTSNKDARKPSYHQYHSSSSSQVLPLAFSPFSSDPSIT